MLEFGVLDVAMPTPTNIIIDSGLWIPLSIGILVIIALIVAFIRTNQGKKRIEKNEEENKEE